MKIHFLTDACRIAIPYTAFRMKKILALIITDENTLKNGFLALMTTLSGIATVLVADNYFSGLRMITNHQPGLLVLDMALEEDGAKKILAYINSRNLNTCILF
jgi:response regulator of citrate/malate metabolism